MMRRHDCERRAGPASETLPENCDYLCLYIYTNPQAPVTYDHCTAGLVFRIDAGKYGDILLNGLKFALVICSSNTK